MYVVRTAAVSGPGVAMSGALGIGTGCLVWATASALGITALLAASSVAYTVMRWAGAAYLVFLGLRAIRRHSATAPPPEPPSRRAWASFRVGLLTNLLNPKIGAFYLAALPQFLPRGANPLGASVLLGLVHDVEGLIWFSVLVLVVRRAASWFSRPVVRRRLELVTGVAFVAVGVRLAAT
jgi:threonine/homoserine/homoserine lactone efflux protein